MRKFLTEGELRSFFATIEPLASAFDALGDHVVITDPNAVIVYANEAVTRNTGFSHAEIIGKNPADLWGGAMPQEFYRKMWHTIKEEKKPFAGEVKNKRKDGTEYWQELHISPVLDAAGEIRFFIGIEPNITERKAREQFSNEFFHLSVTQLETPLASIRWLLERLLNSGGLTEVQRRALEELYSRSRGLADTVGDLFIVSRLAHAESTHETVDLRQELGGIIEALRIQFSDVAFHFETYGDVFMISSVRMLVHEVCKVLLDNAAEYSHKKGGEVYTALSARDGTYLVSIRDNGIGIPPEDQPKIFSRLFRASNAKLMKEFGTGLDLFTAKMIADRFG